MKTNSIINNTDMAAIGIDLGGTKTEDWACQSNCVNRITVVYNQCVLSKIEQLMS